MVTSCSSYTATSTGVVGNKSCEATGLNEEVNGVDGGRLLQLTHTSRLPTQGTVEAFCKTLCALDL